MIRGILLAIAGTLALSGATFAAEPVPVPPPPPVFNWTGFYIGVDGGFGGGVVDANLTLVTPLFSTLHTSNRTGGFVAGGQVGYNYQFPSNIVLGLESDGQWADVKESEHEIATAITPVSVRFTDLRIGLDWFGTTRLRLGYALGHFLPYITGGVAYGQVAANGSQVIFGAGASTATGSTSRTQVGWTAGAGAEYAITDNLSLKAEYLFVDLRGVSGPVAGFAPPIFPIAGSFTTGRLGTNIVRGGLNWRFGGLGAAPVVATY